jgi:hypothetical protein
MNLTKKELKSQYSMYRKHLNEAYNRGKESFVEQLNSNEIFRAMSSKSERPVSVKVWLYKNP